MIPKRDPNLINDFHSSVKNSFSSHTAGIKEQYASGKNAIQAAHSTLSKNIHQHFANFGLKAHHAAMQTRNSIGQKIRQTMGTVKKDATNMWEGTKRGAKEAWKETKRGANDAWNTGKTFATNYAKDPMTNTAFYGDKAVSLVKDWKNRKRGVSRYSKDAALVAQHTADLAGKKFDAAKYYYKTKNKLTKWDTLASEHKKKAASYAQKYGISKRYTNKASKIFEKGRTRVKRKASSFGKLVRAHGMGPAGSPPRLMKAKNTYEGPQYSGGGIT